VVDVAGGPVVDRAADREEVLWFGHENGLLIEDLCGLLQAHTDGVVPVVEGLLTEVELPVCLFGGIG
jgi:hypothetical protein